MQEWINCRSSSDDDIVKRSIVLLTRQKTIISVLSTGQTYFIEQKKQFTLFAYLK